MPESIKPNANFWIAPEPEPWEPGDTNPFGDPRIEDQNIKLGAEEKEFWRQFAEKEGLDVPKFIRRAMYFYYKCYPARHQILKYTDLLVGFAQIIVKKISELKGT